MSINTKLQAKLSKLFKPDSIIHDSFNGKDISFKTNASGEPVTLFIGKRRDDGAISGERYVRTIVRDQKSNAILKSHWDLKGKVTHHQ
jgi:hypothetical protein